MGDIERSDQLEARRRRLRRLAVAASLAAAILLSVCVGVASAARSDPPSSLVLEQLLDGVTQCVSPDATCTIVNLYGQNGDPGPSFIAPGEQHVTIVALRNTGSLAASSLDMSAGLCTSQLCETVTVTVLCTTGGMMFSFGPTTLTTFGASGTHAVNSGLAPGASTTCTFTVAYPTNAPHIVFARSVQPVTWTLTAEEVPPTTTAPPTTTPASAPPPPSAPIGPPGAAVIAPSAVAPPTPGAPSPPGLLARTGTDALALAIAGLVLLAMGAVLFWLSRRSDRRYLQGYRE